MRSWPWLLGLVASMLLAGAAQAAAPATPAPTGVPMAPFLRIDTGMHGAVINRIAAAGGLAATASDDKTVRLWSLPSGDPVATLRVPVGPGDEGALYAVALSPDAKTLVAAGYTGRTWDGAFCLYLFSVPEERMLGRLAGLPATINHLAFSPDGRRFAAAFSGKVGVRVWDAKTGKLVGEDRDYGDRATFVAYDAAGRFATTSYDGQIRLYDSDAKLLAKKKAPGGRPFSIAFSPDGALLAVGYEDQPRVDLLSGRDLALRFSPDTAGLKAGGLNAVAWQPGAHGAVLAAAGTARDASGAVVMRRWADLGLGDAADVGIARDSVAELVGSDAGLLFASAEPSWGLVDANGQVAVDKRGGIADFRGVNDARFAVSADGRILEFALGPNQPKLRFDIAQRSLVPAPTADPALARAQTQGLPITDWRNSAAPKLAGKPLRLDDQELARSLAIAPDRQRFLLGTDYNLRLYGANGVELKRVAVPATAWGVAIAGNGTVAVAALGDGTIRWYGLGAGDLLAERVALFPDGDSGRWIAWTPEGFFDHADSGGKELVGYLFNRGKAQSPEWVSFAQVYRLLYAPELVAGKLAGTADAAIRDRLAALGDIRTRFDQLAPPAIEIIDYCLSENGHETCTAVKDAAERTRAAQAPAPPASLGAGTALPGAGAGAPAAVTFTMVPAKTVTRSFDVALPTDTKTVKLRYRAVDRGGGVGALDFFLNDRNVGRQKPTRALARDLAQGSLGEQEIPLDPGLNRVQIRAYDAANGAYAPSRPLVLAAGKGGDQAKPRLLVLAAAVNRYASVQPLQFPVADAQGFIATLKDKAANLFSEIKTVELYDEQATVPAINQALQQLADTAQTQDTVLIYISGHGDMVGDNYFYIPQNFDMTGVDTEKALHDAEAAHSFTGQMLVEALGRIKARNGFVFLDTCHSGALTLDAGASQINHESGRYILTAASSAEEALDSYDNRHGVFAYALLEALDGKAPKEAGGELDNFQLGFYVAKRVADLAREKDWHQTARFKIATQDAVPFPLVKP